MEENRTFEICLINAIKKDSRNYYKDNIDYERYSDARSFLVRLIKRLFYFVSYKISYRGKFLCMISIEDISSISFSSLSNVYNLLNDTKSKELLVKLIEFRLLDSFRVKIPSFTYDQLEKKRLINKAIRTGVTDASYINWKLKYFDLNILGYRLNLFCTEAGIFNIFILKQYEFNRDGMIIRVELDDVVIDAGGCWGDSALYFANQVGPHGKVYSFEFLPTNIEIMKKNILLNDGFQNRISIIDKPLWSSEGHKIYYTAMGPGSKVSSEKINENYIETETVTIDGIVETSNMINVDFIKMDIEGAELAALKGACKTIIKFKPKLAISVYHNISDFYTIPEYILTLEPKYDFYLDHYTLHGEETILYGICTEDIS